MPTHLSFLWTVSGYPQIVDTFSFLHFVCQQKVNIGENYFYIHIILTLFSQEITVRRAYLSNLFTLIYLESYKSVLIHRSVGVGSVRRWNQVGQLSIVSIFFLHSNFYMYILLYLHHINIHFKVKLETLMRYVCFGTVSVFCINKPFFNIWYLGGSHTKIKLPLPSPTALFKYASVASYYAECSLSQYEALYICMQYSL